MREEVIWTDLTPREIGEALMEKDLYISEPVIRRLLNDEGYHRRQIQKYLDMVTRGPQCSVREHRPDQARLPQLA